MTTSTVEIGEILTSLLDKTGLSEAALARNVNLPRATINRLTSGRTPDPRASTLQAIAQYFNVSVGQLIGTEPLFISRDKTISANLECSIPVIAMQQAKNWQTVIKDLTSHNHFHWIICDASIDKAKFAVTVEGEAMQPQFRENTLLVIDATKKPLNRDFVIAHIHKTNSVLFRQLIIDGQYNLLKPVNNLFSALPLEDFDKIIGTVIQTRSTF